MLHWKGGLISQISVDLPKPKPPYRTSEDTVSLIGRLAAHYDDSMIAKVLNQQQRRTATGMSFTPVNVASIRKRHGIPARQTGNSPDPEGDVMSVHQAAAELGTTASTLYRWLNDGFVPGEQITPGAPWRIRLTESIRNLVADDAPRRLGPRPGRHRIPRRLQANRVAACQARRTPRRPHPRRTQERPAYRATHPPRRAVLAIPRQ